MNFLNLMLCCHFSLEAVLHGMAKNSPNEKQIDVESQATLKHAPVWKLTEEKNVKFIVTSYKERFTS